MRRLTIRARLTLLWGALFLAAGVVLLGLTYVLVDQQLRAQRAGVVGAVQIGPPPSEAPPPPNAPVDSEFTNPTPADIQRLTRAADRIRKNALNSLLTQGGIALGVVALVGMGFGWLMAERALRPLSRITETARRVADRNLHERIALAGPRDEIKELADTFDSMLERLDRAFDSQLRFVGNASHELRTPLAINRTLIEVALGRASVPEELRLLGDTLLAVNRRHERLLDGLLTLVRSEQGLTVHDPVDLADIAGHVLVTRGGAARSDLAAAPALGDPVLLERVVQNLVENANTYNVPDGWVSVATRTVDGQAELTVANTGPVVPAYEVPTLFEPFRRLRDRVNSTNGTGLGLSIVRSVAQAHGGSVAAVPRDGGGLVVRVTLPVRKN
jgi:signal transduction histidine kinase